MISPIHVGHKLVAEVYFSVHGEDDQGQTMAKPGPGGLRVMRISRPVVVPSVRYLLPPGVSRSLLIDVPLANSAFLSASSLPKF